MTETTNATSVRLAMGDAIPEWLIVFEPRADVPPGLSRRGNPRFATDVEVIETEERFYVMARTDRSLTNMLDTTGMEACVAWAATKPVVLFMAWHTVEPHETPVGLQAMAEIPGFNKRPAPAPADFVTPPGRPAPTDGSGGPVQRAPLPDDPSKWPKPARPWWKRLFS